MISKDTINQEHQLITQTLMYFIEDLELKYQREMSDTKFTILNITERIDMIVDAISQKISSTLVENVYLKFFLRRTLNLDLVLILI